jgi:2,4'-dihydroxyacetophenone dioxygenase
VVAAGACAPLSIAGDRAGRRYRKEVETKMPEQKTMPPMPAGMPSVEEVLLQSNDIPWRAKSLAGVSEKMLWRDEKLGSSIALIKFDAGAGIPEPHLHASNQFMFCLTGKYEYTKTGVTLTPGSFYWNPKGHVHGPTLAHEETIVLEIYDGPHYPQRPSWYANDEDAR